MLVSEREGGDERKRLERHGRTRSAGALARLSEQAAKNEDFEISRRFVFVRRFQKTREEPPPRSGGRLPREPRFRKRRRTTHLGRFRFQ
mmetsp:Transcript_3973/g.7601  ORF Transcript_3973/g.7601 Transcript_3973/m.7601 type:complete len:89 (-) Transcript_3973:1877-2143(-)